MSSKIKTSLDSAPSHLRPSSKSGLFKREDCFTLPRAEQVRGPLSCNNARSTAGAKSPDSCFQARSSYSYQHYVHAVRGKRHTTNSALSRATLVSTLLSCCTHEERRKIVSVRSHAKLVSIPFSRYHARSIVRHKLRQQQHHNREFIENFRGGAGLLLRAVLMAGASRIWKFVKTNLLTTEGGNISLGPAFDFLQLFTTGFELRAIDRCVFYHPSAGLLPAPQSLSHHLRRHRSSSRRPARGCVSSFLCPV